MRAGLNAPPIHPNCHCTTAPHIDTDEYEAWLSYLEQGGTSADWANMSPAERQKWYNNIVKSIQPSAPTNAFTPAKTISEAEAYANSLGLEAHYKGVSIETANAMNESFKRGIDFCSKVKDRLRMVGSGQESNKLFKAHLTDYYKQTYGVSDKQAQKLASKTVGRIGGDVYAFARSTKEDFRRFSGIFVNKPWADYDKMSAQLKIDVKSGFHPVGCDTVKSVFDHEMGHQLDYALGLNKDGELTRYYNSLTSEDIKNGLSKYALKNKKEFIAEAYAEYLNNPEPREIARTVGEIIEKRARQ